MQLGCVSVHLHSLVIEIALDHFDFDIDEFAKEELLVIELALQCKSSIICASWLGGLEAERNLTFLSRFKLDINLLFLELDLLVASDHVNPHLLGPGELTQINDSNAVLVDAGGEGMHWFFNLEALHLSLHYAAGCVNLANYSSHLKWTPLILLLTGDSFLDKVYKFGPVRFELVYQVPFLILVIRPRVEVLHLLFFLFKYGLSLFYLSLLSNWTLFIFLWLLYHFLFITFFSFFNLRLLFFLLYFFDLHFFHLSLDVLLFIRYELYVYLFFFRLFNKSVDHWFKHCWSRFTLFFFHYLNRLLKIWVLHKWELYIFNLVLWLLYLSKALLFFQRTRLGWALSVQEQKFELLFLYYSHILTYIPAFWS